MVKYFIINNIYLYELLMINKSQNPINEINIKELYHNLWAYKVFIVVCVIFGFVSGGYVALNTNKQFTASSLFKLSKKQAPSIPGLGELGALASFAGFNANKTTAVMTILEKVKGRSFIQNLSNELDLSNDPFFNSYNPNYEEPEWKRIIKNAIGYKSASNEKNAIIWLSIYQKYKSNINITETEAGNIKLKFTHEDPQKAALIVNHIMDMILKSEKDKREKSVRSEMLYLTNTLATASYDLEEAENKLKVYALENSSNPLNNFINDSLLLQSKKNSLKTSEDYFNAVNALSLLMENGATKDSDYKKLQKDHPIINQMTFRRTLGQTENINEWSWPSLKYILELRKTLSERAENLQFDFLESTQKAKISADQLEIYKDLERNVKIQQATFTILTEQVKASALVAGYQPDESEIFEYAETPVHPVAPKRSAYILTAGVIGFLLGSAIALILSYFKDVYYSNTTPNNILKPKYNFNVKKLLRLKRKKMSILDELDLFSKYPVLRNMALEINKTNKKLILVSSLNKKLTGKDLARILSAAMQSKDTKIVRLDFSRKPINSDTKLPKYRESNFTQIEGNKCMELLTPQDINPINYITNKKAIMEINSLLDDFNFVLMSADKSDSINLASALQDINTFHIVIVKSGHTKLTQLNELSDQLSTDVMLYV
jgi:uncharacterized protein involved in exopolysaccharide biosynthesis